jgi:glycosyltransferase involved in cell wall biosynthesis
VPVVCPRTGPLPDILGEAAEWCEDSTVAAVAEGLIKVLSDQGRQAQLRSAGLDRATAFTTWAESARAVLDAYEIAAAG